MTEETCGWPWRVVFWLFITVGMAISFLGGVEYEQREQAREAPCPTSPK